MALTTQIVVVCAIVGLSSAHNIFNHHRHRPQNDLGGMPQLLTDMFHPRDPIPGLLQIKPINNPGILGFQSFDLPGLGDFSGGMFGDGQGGFGTEDFMPVSSAPVDRENGYSQSPANDFVDQEGDPFIGTETPQDVLGGQFNNNNNEMVPSKHDDIDNSNKDQESGKSNSVEKEGDDQKAVSPETDSSTESKKEQSGDDSVSKQRDKDAIIFPDRVDQAKDEIAKESSYYQSPQPTNGYVSSPGPQVIYTYAPSYGSSSNQVPYVPNTVQSNTQSQPAVSTVQNYPSTNNVNVQPQPQPQYQTIGNLPTGNVVSNNPPTNPGYTLVPLPNNGANGNSPVYYTNNAPVSNTPPNTNYQPLNAGQQYYMVSMNGQNVLVPINSVQTVPTQSNGNNHINLIPINQGGYVPSNNQVNYVPVNSQNVSPSSPQNNGQVHYIAVQLAPQNNPQNNNQAVYVPANQGIVQTPVQNTPQGSVSYVPLTSQPTMQTPPQNNNQVRYVSGNPPQGVQMPQNNNQVTYVSGNPPQVVQVPPQNNNQVTYVSGNPPQVVQTPPQNSNQVTYVSGNPPQVVQTPPQNNNQVTYVSGNPPRSNNQVNYVPANPQTVVQAGSNYPTNSGQVTYVPLNPQSTTQYKLVPFDPQSNGQGNLVKLVPATLTSNGNVPLLVFKEKAKLSSKEEKKHKE